MSKPTNSIIDLKNIHLDLKSDAGMVNVLRGISLTVNSQKIVSIVGPSGSGKSTLMMVLSGLEKPTTGTVTVAGHVLNDMDEDALAEFRRDHVGIVFQNFHLVPTMTALENVAIPLEFAGKKNAFEKAKGALTAVGLEHRLTHYPGQLSGGEQQRVAIARAFVIEPELLLADEPTGNLDGETGAQVIDVMFNLSREKGTTLVLITHDPALADRCDQTINLVDGKILEGRAKKAANA